MQFFDGFCGMLKRGEDEPLSPWSKRRRGHWHQEHCWCDWKSLNHQFGSTAFVGSAGWPSELHGGAFHQLHSGCAPHQAVECWSQKGIPPAVQWSWRMRAVATALYVPMEGALTPRHLTPPRLAWVPFFEDPDISHWIWGIPINPPGCPYRLELVI